MLDLTIEIDPIGNVSVLAPLAEARKENGDAMAGVFESHRQAAWYMRCRMPPLRMGPDEIGCSDADVEPLLRFM